MQPDSTTKPLEETIQKQCSVCKEWKTPADFHRRTASPDGLSYKCRPCQKAYKDAQYALTREASIARSKAWHQKNPERSREIKRASQARHIEQKRARGRGWYSRALHEDPELTRLKVRIHNGYWRAKKAGVTGNVTWQQALVLLKRADSHCQYCGKVAPLTLDHMQPLNHKGRHVASNLVPVCKSCNSSKASKPVDEWLYQTHGVDGLGRVLLFLDKRKKANQI